MDSYDNGLCLKEMLTIMIFFAIILNCTWSKSYEYVSEFGRNRPKCAHQRELSVNNFIRQVYFYRRRIGTENDKQQLILRPKKIVMQPNANALSHVPYIYINVRPMLFKVVLFFHQYHI